MEDILAHLQYHYDHLLLLDNEVGSEHWVHVTNINNPVSFYVRPTICSNFINKLGSIEPDAKVESVNLHDMVIISLEVDALKYVRGKILNIENTASGVKCDVLAIDFGYIVRSVPLQNIWQYDERYLNFPPLATHCRLANCAPLSGRNWSQSTINAFKFYVGNESAKIIILEKTFDQLVVELYNNNPDDIATLLALNGYTTPGFVPNGLAAM